MMRVEPGLVWYTWSISLGSCATAEVLVARGSSSFHAEMWLCDAKTGSGGKYTPIGTDYSTMAIISLIQIMLAAQLSFAKQISFVRRACKSQAARNTKNGKYIQYSRCLSCNQSALGGDGSPDNDTWPCVGAETAAIA